ncbi:MAG: alginate lyase family protein [Bacteroidota bacterium]
MSKVTCDENWVVENYPEKVDRLFIALDLTQPGLTEVKKYVESNQLPKACKALVEYYRNLDRDSWKHQWIREKTRSSQGDDLAAQSVLQDSIVIQSRKGTFARKANGRIDWQDLGPVDDKEWGWFLNRLTFMYPIISQYVATKGAKYIRFMDETLQDWFISNPMPSEKTDGSSWRVLEVALRAVQQFPQLFYLFQDEDEFAVGTRILFLASVAEHAEYISQYHAVHHNHSVMEMNGLATIALMWPEFKESETWYQHATAQILDDITFLVYPDGVEIELTSMYHRVALKHFEAFYDLSQAAGKAVNPTIATYLENMWNYLAFSIRPNGTGLLNNDSNLDSNVDELLKAAVRYNRPDWKYIITNGKSGEAPKTGPSYNFNWAGNFINRNNWSADAHWDYFDNGCWGWAHQHDDRLHISVHAHGRDLLVDGGRYWYKDYYTKQPDTWRGYFVNSAAHNVILVDGKGQKSPGTGSFHDRIKLEAPLPESMGVIQPDYDFAKGVWDGGYWDVEGDIEHTRSFIYIRDKYWLVIDKMEVDRPRTIDVLWHFHPYCTAEKQGKSVVSVDTAQGNLRIVSSNDNWEISMVKGRELPNIQGWYSPSYNVKQPNSVAIYQRQIESSTRFAWLLLPADGQVAAANLESIFVEKDKVQLVVTTASSTESYEVDLEKGTVDFKE